MSPSSSLYSSSSSSSSSPSSFSSSSSGGPRAEVVSLSSGGAPSEAAGSSIALETLKSWHIVDLVVTKELLRILRDRYRISKCYGVHAPRPVQWPYDQFPDGFGLTMGGLERYLVAFLRECRGVGIEPTRTLFLAYFRLCKGRGREMTEEWLVEAGLSPAIGGEMVDLQSVKKTPHAKAAAPPSWGDEGSGAVGAS
ncbi:hypothetical protein C4D60_Mb03t19620 [Musa balbisiana]|uniref:Uncharacterized protein n=1 Tax=Musa balbisiana TaxID=52838 RepID=A0A4S8JBF9_MUSBA|nr:hypothetical protein C4D60_Mb03t19620 [Musa balbisiana]